MLCADYDLNVDHYNVIADAMQAEGNPHGEWLTAWLLPDEQQRGRALLPLCSAMAEYVEAEVEHLLAERRARYLAQLTALRAEHCWGYARNGKTTHVSELFGTVHDELIVDDLMRQEDVQPLLGIMDEVHEPAVAVMPKVNAERLSLETLTWLIDPSTSRSR